MMAMKKMSTMMIWNLSDDNFGNIVNDDVDDVVDDVVDDDVDDDNVKDDVLETLPARARSLLPTNQPGDRTHQ